MKAVRGVDFTKYALSNVNLQNWSLYTNYYKMFMSCTMYIPFFIKYNVQNQGMYMVQRGAKDIYAYDGKTP